MNISTALDSAAGILMESGIPEPRREAASLLVFIIGREPAFLIAHPEYLLSPDETARFSEAVRRRGAREPFHYITGVKEFYALEFEVGPGILIPRPETELLVEEAVKLLGALPASRFLEIGVGSGCISISILNSVRTAEALAVDISEAALRTARSNAVRNGVTDRLLLENADVFGSIEGKFDLVVSNPPYIPEGDRPGLQPEVALFEPEAALFAGESGLDVIGRIITDAPRFLLPEGSLLIEIGFGQAASVKTMFDPFIWDTVRFISDLQGIERAAVARLVGRAQ